MKHLILAQHQFWHGVHAGSPTAAEVLKQAEREIYIAITNEDDLKSAAYVLRPELEERAARVKANRKNRNQELKDRQNG